MTDRLVLDALVRVELVLNTEIGSALRTRVPSGAEEWVPEIYMLEVAAVLRRAELAGRLSRERASVAFDRLLTAPLTRVQDMLGAL